MRIFQSVTQKFVYVSLVLFTIPIILPAQTLSQILATQTERTLIAQESQVRVDKVATQTRSMEDQYRATLKEIDGLLIYNKLLELQIENQERVKVDLEQSIANVAIVNRQIVPVMTRMIDSLDQFIVLDVPFLNKERTDRVNGLKIYNKLLELQIENQERVKIDLEQSIANVAIVNRQIVPVMTRMIDSLEQFIALDVPFLNQERTDRVEGLKELMSRQDVTVAEKFRKVTEAYQIENDYGRTIETYKDTLDVDGAILELDFLRIGRISLMYQSVDGKISGVWNQKTQSWEDASNQRNQIKLGLSIAKKQVPPDLVILPVDSPEAA